MPPDPTKQTSCKHCLFSVYENNTQTGCELGRIEKFGDLVISAYDNDKEFYVIDRICNMHRGPNWNDGIKDIKKAYEESCMSFDIFIDCDDINDDYAEKISNELANISYPSNKYSITFFHSCDLDISKRKLISQLHSKFKSTISLYLDRTEYLESIIFKAKNAFHLLLNKNNVVEFASFIREVDRLINIDLKRFVICKHDNKVTLSNMACRIMYSDLYVDYDKNILAIEADSKKDNLYFEF